MWDEKTHYVLLSGIRVYWFENLEDKTILGIKADEFGYAMPVVGLV